MGRVCTFSSKMINVCVVWISYAPNKQDVTKASKQKNTWWTWMWHTAEFIVLSQEDEGYDMTEDHKRGGRGRHVSAHLSDFCHIGGTLTLRPLQLRLQVLLFSSHLQSRTEVQRYLWLRQNVSLNYNKLRGNASVSLRCVFQEDWHFPTRLHQLVSQSLAPELWLSGSSKVRDKGVMQWKAHAVQSYVTSVIWYSVWGVVSC